MSIYLFSYLEVETYQSLHTHLMGVIIEHLVSFIFGSNGNNILYNNLE